MKRKELKINKKILLISAMLLLLATIQSFAETPEQKGLALVERIDTYPKIERMMSETVLDIYDAQGKKLFSKKSRTASFTEHFREKDKRLRRSISYFYAPADDKGNGALMIEVADADDDQWIYLKGLRKPKRIIGSDKSSSFMGSDFSNGDIGARDIDDATYKWLATEKIAFKSKKLTVEKIQSRFKKESMRKDYGYSKTILWLHVKSGLPIKMENYNLSGQLLKRARLLSFAVKKNRDGKKVFIPTAFEMRNMIKGTKTVMRMKHLKVEKRASKVKPGIFKLKYLTRKWW